MSEMKNMLDGVNGRLDVTEEKISEFEDIGIKTIQNEMQTLKMNRYQFHTPIFTAQRIIAITL